MFKKQLVFFLVGFVVSLLSLLAVFSIINRLISFPIFFISIFLSLLIPIVVLLIYKYILKIKIYDKMHLFMIYCVYFLGLLVFSIFGPVFIERSFSYYVVMDIAKKEKLSQHATIDDVAKIIKHERNTSLRIEQIKSSGLISLDDKGNITPNYLIKIIAYVMYSLGVITNTLGEYNEITK